MTLRLNGNLQIENLRGYPEPVVQALRQLLRQGVPAVPDPKRVGFYEVRADGHGFYFHLWHPEGSKREHLLLLAHWAALDRVPRLRSGQAAD